MFADGLSVFGGETPQVYDVFLGIQTINFFKYLPSDVNIDLVLHVEVLIVRNLAQLRLVLALNELPVHIALQPQPFLFVFPPNLPMVVNQPSLSKTFGLLLPLQSYLSVILNYVGTPEALRRVRLRGFVLHHALMRHSDRGV